MAAKDEATLRLARWVAPVWIAILLAAVVFCGWCARVLYSGLENPEQSLAVIASRFNDEIVSGLIDGAVSCLTRHGADDEGEMGVMHALFQPQRETNLRIRLEEYLRFGLRAGLIYET